ncbi:MAG: ABC transporter ATP-binding protein [Alphaproteobacteria bacterium]
MVLDSPVLSAVGISKTYRERSLRELLAPSRLDAGVAHVALHSFDLVLARGASLGIVGRNGAGKSTLLRILAGVARPSSGQVRIDGRCRSLLDLGAGMFEEMTGRENALTQLAIDGLDQDEAARAWKGILDFSGLAGFADAPLRTYSSGMRVRLAYAIAIAVPCDVLVADEVLAVGDEEFQRRCSRHVSDFLAAGRSLVLASHNLYHVEKLCRDAIWIEEGKVRASGPAREVTAAYRSWIDAADPDAPESAAEAGPDVEGADRRSGVSHERRSDRFEVEVRTRADGLDTNRLQEGGEFEARFSAEVPRGSRLEVNRPGGLCVLDLPIEGRSLRIAALPLLPGRYRLRLVAPGGRVVTLTGDEEVDCVGASRDLGLLRLRHSWRGSVPA